MVMDSDEEFHLSDQLHIPHDLRSDWTASLGK